jgi:glycosyltransferase involved in cell wall biosynthesis
MIKLSIIIPVYNSEPYVDELMRSLMFQVTKEVEVIVVDDGSTFPYVPGYPAVKLFRKENGGVSSARNLGLNKARGEYIVFIDSDDIVAEDYIQRIFQAIESNPDTVYISWKSIDGKLGKIISGPKDEFNPWNRCVWNRVFKRTYIKGMRFNEEMPVAEDDDFLNHLPATESKTYIDKPIYFYRSGRKGSLTDRNLKGEFKQADIKTQVVVYCGSTQSIGGVETFIYQFCKEMKEYYDILVLYTDHMDGRQIVRLAEHVPIMKNMGKLIDCDTVINVRLTDEVPTNVRYKKRIQMSHTCQLAPFGKWHWEIKQNYDELIFVSQAAADSFSDQNLEYSIIPNLTESEEPRKSLLLVSACRLTWEKGEERMYQFAEMLRSANIPFVWLVFSSGPLSKTIPGVIQVPATLDVRSFFLKADYVVQLSDIESFCYTLAEALELGVPVLTTPLSVLPEIGFAEGENGYVLPFDMKNIDINKIYSQIPKFEARRSRNNDIIKQWRKVLGNTKPKNRYNPNTEFIDVTVIECYGDLELNRNMTVGERVRMRKDRAIMLMNRGLVVGS